MVMKGKEIVLGIVIVANGLAIMLIGLLIAGITTFAPTEDKVLMLAGELGIFSPYILYSTSFIVIAAVLLTDKGVRG